LPAFTALRYNFEVLQPHPVSHLRRGEVAGGRGFDRNARKFVVGNWKMNGGLAA
jgi:hypothetical protein